MCAFFNSVIMCLLILICTAGAGALIMMAANVAQICYKNIKED